MEDEGRTMGVSCVLLRILKDIEESFDSSLTVSEYKEARLATSVSVRHRMPTPRFEKGGCGLGSGGRDCGSLGGAWEGGFRDRRTLALAPAWTDPRGAEED